MISYVTMRLQASLVFRINQKYYIRYMMIYDI